MKKLLSLFVFIIFTPLLFAGQLTYTYHFSAPTFSVKGNYTTIGFDNTMQSALSGDPSLPYLSIKLLLPPGEVVSGMEIIRENEQLIEGYFTLEPYQPSRPLSETKAAEFSYNPSTYQSSEAYPKEAGRTPGTHFMNGFGFALGAFTPVNFIPAKGQLSYFEQVTIVLHTAPEEKAQQASAMLPTSENFSIRARKFADNPEAISQYQLPKTRTTDQYKLLILTTDQFADGFTELTDMYLQRGIRSEITTKETIIANGTGNDVPQKIRNYIIEEYQNHGVEFVLLGGDVELIPYRGFFCHVQSGGGYEDDNIPADLYYSALDGTWDDNGNFQYGEPDEDDLLPEVAVARFPFSSSEELENMIHKSHYYQNFPVTGELTNALLAGENLYNDPETWGSDYLELLIGERSDNGYTTNGIPTDYNFERLYEENQAWTKYDLMNSINSGKQMVHHVGHASPTYVAYMSNSDITNANFSGANGIDHNYTLLQTHGCDCGSFDYSDCILEKMVTIDNFAVAIMGNSRFGWFNEGQTEGPAAHLHREMMDALYNEEIRFLGNAFLESKIQTAPWVEASGQWEEGALRWNFYDLNTLGDPALSVWTNEPIAIDVSYENEIIIGSVSTELTVLSGGDPMQDFVCSVIKDGILCGTAETNANGVATITFDEEITQPGAATLIVVGRNCLPTEYAVEFIPGNGAYVVFSDFQINDELGNNNQLADYNETVMLTITIGNVGLDMAEDLNATLSAADPYVTITDNSANFGNVASGQQATVEDAFTVEIHDNIPDQHMINFTLSCATSTDAWESMFGITAQAPILEIGEVNIADVTGGNNSGSLDPGETDSLYIDASNFGHSDCWNTEMELNTTSPYVTINNDIPAINELLAGETKVVGFEVQIQPDAPIGTVVEFVCSMQSGTYQTETTYYLPIGLVMEDFETGDFSRFEWQNGGQLAWTVDSSNPFAGAFSAKSGAISDLNKSELFIELEVITSDDISFWRKVSSEADYDFLRFYVDGSLIREWSGELDWEEESFTLNPGAHTLKWIYEKDINTIGGLDAAWLDNIIFPPTATILNTNPIFSDLTIRVYPNPANEAIYIASEGADITDVKVSTLMGNIINGLNLSQQNTNTYRVDISSLKPGLYLMELTSEQKTVVKKIMVQ